MALIGAGGHAKVIIEIIEEMDGRIVFVNDDESSVTTVLGYSVSVEKPPVNVAALIAVGNNRTRKKIALEAKNPFETAVHPRANLSSRCKIGEGTVVMAGATINSETRIGKHCIINTNASVDHDCEIEDFVHIAPGSSVAGGVSIGEGTLVGIGSAIVPGIRIGKWATIGAGSVVIENVPDYAVVVGVPADIIKYNQ
ncbi:acetyltransferase [Sediminibacterium roseum]|uniref:Acetyltransferase n=1 Tax=Sediminibacterium roseum TaxID=1978412 RepID=A0ABW9ZPM5_9BACT|nr:acetyltransferase [Sediminibacterium roseum]